MTDATSTTPPVAPDGAGAMLRAARQQQGLHIAALAASIKVTPANGAPPYYLVDQQGNGNFMRMETMDGGVRVPQWVIRTF